MESVKIIRWNYSSKPALDILRKQLEKEGLDPYSYHSPKGDYYPDHKHAYNEVRVIVTGSMKFGANGKEFVLKPGDRLELKKNTVHWAETMEDCLSLAASRKWKK